jgi:hypothetical protein
MKSFVIAAVIGVCFSGTRSLHAQYPPGKQNSPNVHVAFHLPLVGATDIRVDQELSRPYVYQAVGSYGPPSPNVRREPAGFHIISVKDPSHASLIYSWHIPNPELHQGNATGVMLFKQKGRYYAILSTQFGQTGPDNDVVGVVFDVTGLPDTSKVKDVARIKNEDNKGGSHEAFTYKHSDGRALFFTTVARGPFADIYDMQKVLAGGDPANGRVGRVPTLDMGSAPDPNASPTIYHDFVVAYDPATHQDRFYGGGWLNLGPGGGEKGFYVVYDVTRPEAPKVLASVTGVAGVDYAHTFTPSPDGRYAIAESEHQFQPLKFFDLKPGLDGTARTISRPIGAWTANWTGLVHQMEVRWPYVFVAGYSDGVQVVNMMDPTNPYTVGYWDTYERPTLETPPPESTNNANVNSVYVGNWGIDIRNADGLFVASDTRSGTWGFKMDGFDGWNGHQWGMPNNSSAQDWDNGPDGAAKPTS